MASIVEYVSALGIGRIEAVTAAELRIALFAETPQATALNTGTPVGFPRVNAYVLVPNEGGAVVAVVKEIFILRRPTSRQPRDESTVDLPFPSRTLAAIPFATLLADTEKGSRRRHYRLERGVPVLPSVGDPVLLPTREQLQSIVEAAESDRLLRIGTAPFAGNAPVWVHPDRMFGRHLAILGNTGSGKSCSVAGLIRWSIEAATKNSPEGTKAETPNARFIILDPNGEYASAFSDAAISMRLFAAGATQEANRLTVPGWLWNGQEWSAFTAAQGGVQRPILLRALRLLRNRGTSTETHRARILHRYRGYVRQLEQLDSEVPQSIQNFPANKNFGDKLQGLVALFESDRDALAINEAVNGDLLSAIQTLSQTIEGVRQSRYYQSGQRSGYNDFQPNDLKAVMNGLKELVERFPAGLSHGEISEDQPVKFDVTELPERIREIAMATGGQAVANVEPLTNRIEVMLGDQRLRPIIEASGASSLSEWLARFLGDGSPNSSPLTVVDLSLVPSDVIHIAVAVIARVVFEALQRYAKAKGEPLPTVLVLEEAHTFVRKEADQGTNAAAGEVCRQVFDRIAREGRKFGLGLVLASQRPSELSPTVLAQCNTFLLHRIVNDVDQNLVKRLVPDILGELLSELPSLPSQQAILLGWAVQTPALVRLRDLDASNRPRSKDPDFWDVWTRHSARPTDLAEIAMAWEGTQPAPTARPTSSSVGGANGE